ncbi:AAA family ATPase [Ligilactobacillus murinus]|nr:AAA family ATPase [Ligilactobacillus murinus]
MARKIKRVILSDFRVFKGENVFDLTNNGKVAKLVILYAPNGWGKTSFFDGIEWGLSGKIKRISKNSMVSNIAEKEKGNILKNKYSNKKFGKVEINFSDNKNFSVRTKELNGRQKTDYRAGNIVEDSLKIGQLSKKNFVDEQILTHDSMDDILTSKSPSERYTSISNMWDDIGISNYYKKLHECSRILKDKKKNLSSEINNKKMEIDKLNKEIEKEIEENELLDIVKRVGLDLKDVASLENINKLSTQIILQKANLEDKLEGINKKIEFSTISEKFLNKYSDIDDKKQAKEHVEKNLEKLFKLKKLSDEKVSIKNEISKLQITYKELQILYQNRDRYVGYLDELEQITSCIHDRKRKKNILNMRLTETKYSKEEIERKYTEYEKKIGFLENLKKIPDLKKSLKKYKKEIGKWNDVESENLVHRNECVTLKYDIDKVKKVNIENLSWDISKEYTNLFAYSDMKDTKNILDDISSQTKNIDKLDSEIGIWRENKDLFTQLKNIGLNLSREQQLDKCPLCNNHYNSFKELEHKIEQNYVSEEKIVDIEQKIQSIKNLRKNNYDTLFEKLNLFKQNIENKIVEFDKKISDARNEIVIGNREFDRINKEYETIISYGNDIFKGNDYTIQDVEEKLNKLKENKGNIASEIKSLSEEIYKLEKSINKADADIQIKINRKEEIESIESYKKFKCKVQNREIENIKEEIGRTKSEIEKLRSKLSENMQKIKDTQKEVEAIDEFSERIKKKKLEEEIEKFYSEKERIEAKCVKIFSVKFDSVKQYGLDTGKYIDDRKKIETDLKWLSQSDSIINKLLENINLEELEKSLYDLSQNYNKVCDIANLIDIEKNRTKEYIDNHIHKRLDIDIINKVFNILEPHAEWKNIGFRVNPEEKAGQGLGLEFICQKNLEGGGSEKEAPILYLSSAQINILCLSIFIAKFISTNNREIDTIFMDDPVEYLDTLNELTFIDLLRIICFELDIQVVISTHDSHFFKLCKNKLSSEYYSAKYINILTDIS